MATAYKWLPVVNEDCCTGCGKCVEACDNDCLQLVWSYANLVGPVMCGSEGTCQEACPEEAIHMEWVSTPGDQQHGRWQVRPDTLLPASSGWTARMFKGFLQQRS
jgi:MinD superfamily P-loop ATPase